MLKAQNNKARTPRHRPDGSDATRYAGMKNWTYRRWAWEFLRRNEAFIKACERVGNSEGADQQEVANQYGLKKFKYYKEAYSGGVGRPRFELGSIHVWSQLPSQKSSIRKIKVEQWQVVIRFDLHQAFIDVKAIEKQLRLAKMRLERTVDLFSKMRCIEPKKNSFKWAVLEKYIRILDCHNAGKRKVEVAEIVDSYAPDPKSLNDKIGGQIKKAKEFSQEKYLYLSVLSGKPLAEK